MAIIVLLFFVGYSLEKQYNFANDPTVVGNVGTVFAGVSIATALTYIYGVAYWMSAAALLKLFGAFLARNWFTSILVILDFALIAVAVACAATGHLSFPTPGTETYISMVLGALMFSNLAFDAMALSVH